MSELPVASRKAETFGEMDHVAFSPEEEAEAEALEQRARTDAQALLKKLKYEANANFGLMHGGPGLRSPEQWAELLEQAGDEIGNGRFLVGVLGAERYLDPRKVAVLLTLRQSLLAEVDRPTAADVMLIDAAVIGWYNMLRAQGWTGNLALQVEADLFGNDVLNSYQGENTMRRIQEDLRRLNDVILPLEDRANKMMVRNLAELRSSSTSNRRRRKAS